MTGTNWTEVAIAEAYFDYDWQTIADLLHKLAKKEKNEDSRRTLICLEEFAKNIHKLYGKKQLAEK